MSKISDVRSRILQLNTFSRFRLCAGVSSSSKMTVSTSARLQWAANSFALPLPMKVAAHGAANFCNPSPTTTPPAVVASSESSSNESPESPFLAPLSSTPIRKTRSVLRVRVSIKAFNSVPVPVLSIKQYHLLVHRKDGFSFERSRKYGLSQHRLQYHVPE